ncbi:uncharacterized protein LOC109798786 [Cajanus cajan]|uniref:DUF868 domain-containing protein n=1 Tax=Cajanus cajan TaxID=3821 RepID=A0A151TNM5_CAJCA|nr:uncharacterized protein LOC109798786 [Cajanus cajan]KYP68649.1 hypothetical protein KK1_022288 [Cajanus cajan]
MRDIVSCLSDNAVNVSHYSSTISCSTISPSIQNSTSTIYTLKQITITVTWCNQGLTITFNHQDPPHFRLNTTSRFFRKKKGSKTLQLHSSNLEILWDLSNAKYQTGPEPLQAFYLVIIVDSELALVLGDTAQETLSKRFAFKTNPLARMVSKREHCSGNTLYTTKARFCDTGTCHDVLIRCSLEKDNDGGFFKSPVLSVCIDKKTVTRVKRLQWNFRGNQTIFVDGLLVDLMWDVHDWFFNNPCGGGYAVFMFRTRSGMDSRLWLEDKGVQKDKERVEFSLLIYACKTS